MTLTQRLVLLGVGLVLLLVTLELIRKRRLREEYAVLWVCTGLMLMVPVLVPSLLFQAAFWLGLDHGVLMTFLCFLFLAAILLHYSVVISRHSEREKALSQYLALLKDELMKLREEQHGAQPPQAQGRKKES